MCPLQSIPVTFARDRCAYVVDLTLYTVESTAFTRQGSLVQIQPRPPISYLVAFNIVQNMAYDCSSQSIELLHVVDAISWPLVPTISGFQKLPVNLTSTGLGQFLQKHDLPRVLVR